MFVGLENGFLEGFAISEVVIGSIQLDSDDAVDSSSFAAGLVGFLPEGVEVPVGKGGTRWKIIQGLPVWN